MDYAKLTQMSRQAVTDAQNTARRLNHNEVDTWHLLAALLAQENGVVPGLLDKLAELFPYAPRLAVTATADARTREDIRRELRLEGAAEFVDSFARPELQLSAERKKGRGRDRVIELVKARAGQAGVVYAGSRDGTDDLAKALRDEGVDALAYHAGLDAQTRADRLEKFLAADAGVMVATIAFGMGVDKPDVRFVIHADPPASIEAYWQEIGRAGRDGQPADGITLYNSADMAWALRRIDSREVGDEVKQVQARKVRQLYGLLKRPDEKYVTEKAYENPKFVEDMVRDVAAKLNADERIDAYVVESENFESIHNHSAYALIEGPPKEDEIPDSRPTTQAPPAL